MMNENDFYNDLGGTLNAAWQLLQDAINDPTSPARTPVLVSHTADGRVDGRSVVLRSCDRGKRQLKHHTDIRSAKVAQLRARPDCTLVVYHPAPNIQLRLGALATVHHDDEATRNMWATLPGPNRCNYLTDPAPGSTSTEATDGRPVITAESVPSEAQEAIAYANFAVIDFTIDRLEWLYLPRRGHRRACFRWDKDGVLHSDWLIP